MISLLNVLSRQCESRVPLPPPFSTGTPTALVPKIALYAATAWLPVNIGLLVPAPTSRPFDCHKVPMPSTWPISWVITASNEPLASMTGGI